MDVQRERGYPSGLSGVRPVSAAVAQWIEYWPPKPRVVGSIPASRATFSPRTTSAVAELLCKLEPTARYPPTSSRILARPLERAGSALGQSKYSCNTKLSKLQRILLGNIILCPYVKYFARYQYPTGTGRYCGLFDISYLLARRMPRTPYDLSVFISCRQSCSA